MKIEPDSFQWCPVAGPKERSTNCNIGGCRIIRKHFLTVGMTALAQVAQGACRISLLKDTQKPSQLHPGQLALGDSACLGVLDGPDDL